MEITTLCYIENDGRYLMLHRVKKKNDINEGKWIAPGGHCENGESPDDCVMREVLEETGLKLKSVNFRGIVTFYSKAIRPAAFANTGSLNSGNATDKSKDNGSSPDRSDLYTEKEQDPFSKDVTDYMCLFTASDFEGELINCDEGTLEWVDKKRIPELNLWKGDLIFLDLISNPEQPFFSLKLTYEGDNLTEAVLDGKVIET